MLCIVSGCALFTRPSSDLVTVASPRQTRLARKANAEGLHWLAYGDPKLAQCAFEKAIRRDESFGPAHNNLGHLFYTAGDMARAAAAFDTASRLLPGDGGPQNNLGLALETGGKPEQALGSYQTAYELDPLNPQFLGNLVRLRLKLDPYDPAIVPQLKELQFIETRPDWVSWIEEQLAVRFNPYLDRGPDSPDLSGLDGEDQQQPQPIIVYEDITDPDATPFESPFESPFDDSFADDLPNADQLPEPREESPIEPEFLPPIPGGPALAPPPGLQFSPIAPPGLPMTPLSPGDISPLPPGESTLLLPSLNP